MGRSALGGPHHKENEGRQDLMFSRFAEWSKFLNQRAPLASPDTV